ncbi:tripartite tricarboxylate transporter substrate binding protein [Pigmentiphaga sp. H8]|uniref:Bug family tripartite tricarboxylate transporter substrate binding protein n=1 Tax=Pigmentiphaga sp. H8 TaxID=2488560 RepID=UPI000F5AB481|nr:tripartite tricarboxylate transporter substrate binding protein [Pigmentiphaga sp. H8]AZG10292.1 tripartite tricarboxylate transporter substrate binding protein [Pigmentiphaga sp. H8]
MQDHRDTSITRRGFIAASAGLALGAAGAARGQGDTYPTRAIRVIVPFPAGAGADSNARLVAQQLAEKLGQPVVVDNRPGANGLIGTEAVAKAAPDGYTLLFVDRGALGINPSLYKKLPYDPLKDFSYVGIAVWGPYVLVAGSKQPAKTIQEFVAAARKQPGRLTYASFGNGSMTQLGTESLCSRLGIQLTHVPYKGGAPALTAAMAGEVDMALVTIGPALGAIREGRVRPLLVGGNRRFPLLPDVPAVSEIGGDENTIPDTYFGFALPAGTPAAIRDRLSGTIRQVLADAAIRTKLADSGFQAARGTPEEMRSTVEHDIAAFGKLARELNIRPE